MNQELKTTAQITSTAIELLCREIGPANTARFIGQFTIGSGDYTRDRDAIVGARSVSDIVSEIKSQRTKLTTSP